LVHATDRFIGRQHCMREKSVVDDRGLIAVAPYRMTRPSRRGRRIRISSEPSQDLVRPFPSAEIEPPLQMEDKTVLTQHQRPAHR
jgi:hypothetical protein